MTDPTRKATLTVTCDGKTHRLRVDARLRSLRDFAGRPYLMADLYGHLIALYPVGQGYAFSIEMDA
jgi:hypothetical protein